MCTHNCVTNDMIYILGRASNYDNSIQTYLKSEITCTQCKFPFYVSSKIKEGIDCAENSNSTVQ